MDIKIITWLIGMGTGILGTYCYFKYKALKYRK